jgi:hypothetical protein
MNLQRDLADVQLGRGLLVEQATRHQREGTSRSRGVSDARRWRKSANRLACSSLRALRQRRLDCPQQIRLLERSWSGNRPRLP